MMTITWRVRAADNERIIHSGEDLTSACRALLDDTMAPEVPDSPVRRYELSVDDDVSTAYIVKVGRVYHMFGAVAIDRKLLPSFCELVKQGLRSAGGKQAA